MFEKLMDEATRGRRETITGIGFFDPASLIATCFGIGRIPFAPGTFGALLGIFVPFLLMFLANSIMDLFHSVGVSGRLVFGFILIFLFQVVLFFVGSRAAKIYMEKTQTSDPASVVIDEVLGSIVGWFTAMLTLALAEGVGLIREVPNMKSPIFFFIVLFFLLVFLFFRAFDIWKPGPIKIIQETMHTGAGVMLDDVLAGIFAGIATNVVFIPVYWIFA